MSPKKSRPENKNGICGIPSRYIFVFMGFMGFFMLYSLKVNLSVAIVAMTKITSEKSANASECLVYSNKSSQKEYEGDFDWDVKTQGIVLGSFFWGYVATHVPGGRLAERFGSKHCLGYSVVVPALLTLLSPWAARAGVGVFIGFRILEGAFEGLYYPGMHSMVARWLPKTERGFLNTIIHTGALIGSVATMMISGVLCDTPGLGWPSVFYITGVGGILWYICWIWLVYESPEEDPYISKKELQYIIDGIGDEKTKKNPKMPWLKVMTSIPVWALIIVHFGQAWGFYTLLLQLPSYFENVIGLSVAANGIVSSVPSIAQAVGGWVSGAILDWIVVRNYIAPSTSRKLATTIAFIGSTACLIAVTFAGCDPTTNVVLFTASMGFTGLFYPGFFLTHIDMSPDFAGTLMGLTNGVANITGIAAPYVVALLTQNEMTIYSWSYVFYITCGIYVFSALVFLIFGDSTLQEWGLDRSHSILPDRF